MAAAEAVADNNTEETEAVVTAQGPTDSEEDKADKAAEAVMTEEEVETFQETDAIVSGTLVPASSVIAADLTMSLKELVEVAVVAPVAEDTVVEEEQDKAGVAQALTSETQTSDLLLLQANQCIASSITTD